MGFTVQDFSTALDKFDGSLELYVRQGEMTFAVLNIHNISADEYCLGTRMNAKALPISIIRGIIKALKSFKPIKADAPYAKDIIKISEESNKVFIDVE